MLAFGEAGFEPGSSNARPSLLGDGALFISCRPSQAKKNMPVGQYFFGHFPVTACDIIINMKVHELNLQPKYYDFIKNGTKRIELRLYDEKRSKIQLGDIIEFSKSESDKLRAEVIGLLRYNSFKDLFEDFDISILADASMTKDELLDALSEFYTPEKQAQYGVIGIRLKILI